jgi:hypothetical protein
VLDDTFKNLRVINNLGNQLIYIPKLSDCPSMTLVSDAYSCEITFPPITFSEMETFTAITDIGEDAGRFAGMTWFNSLWCGYEPTSVPNVVGSNTGATGFAPNIIMNGVVRPYQWREPLLKDGFE